MLAAARAHTEREILEAFVGRGRALRGPGRSQPVLAQALRPARAGRDRARPRLVPGARADLLDPGEGGDPLGQRALRRAAPSTRRSWSTPSASPTSCCAAPIGLPGGAASRDADGRDRRRAAGRAHAGPRAGYRGRERERSTARQAAVLGGNRIPFARRRTGPTRAPRTRTCSPPRSTASSAASAFRVERLGEVAGGRRAQAQPRLQPHPRVRARLARSTPPRPPTTSSRPAAPGSRRRSTSPTRSPWARSRSASPAASTPPPTRRSRSTRTCARLLLDLNRAQSAAGRGSRCSPRLRPGPDRAPDPAQRGAAHGALDGRAPGDLDPALGDRPRGAGRVDRRQPPQARGRLRPRLLRRPGDAVPGARARPEPAPGLDAGEAREAASRCSADGPDADDDRRQLDPALRRRRRRAARQRRVGRGATRCRCSRTSSTPRPAPSTSSTARTTCSARRSTPCRGCSTATASRLQDFDFYEIHEAFASQVLMTLKAWEDPEFCSEQLGRDEPLGAIDRGEDQRRRLVARRRPPVRRHRRADRRDAGEAAGRARARAGG